MSGEETGLVGRDITRLLAIMERLRDPQDGCAWDVAQDFRTIAPYTIEEAHEVADAIARGDLEDLRDELGDLLLQVVFHARMAEEQGAFDFGDVVEAITAKMVRRHPHVFAGADRSPEAIRDSWERIKAQEKAVRRARRAAAGLPDDGAGLFAGVSAGLPPLARALELQRRAAAIGFDWPDAAQVTDKIDEEIGEVKEALAAFLSCDASSPERAAARGALEAEIGDALFALVNLARHVGVDPGQALAATNQKFVNRFSAMEAFAREQGQDLAALDLDALEALWRRAKGAAAAD
ncbi:nucleoside triphosphate pyrophosphohydrolase [Camelimonas abortus]|uniref:Nucleoside triphosphate pyrophosphohydrolase n=1 Tax=Camelimonas abortus TaxID=1017184 RepID=A0ABV7LGJ0_9HYPH